VKNEEISPDSAERRADRDEIRRLRGELDATVRELDALAYAVYHDLRAPLRALDGFSRVVLQRFGDTLDEAGNDYLRRIRAAAQRTNEMVEGLSQLALVGRTELKREPVDVTALAVDIVAELRQAEPERAVQVVVADGLAAGADPGLLGLALRNLLGNAWKFTAGRADARIEVASSGPEERQPAFLVRDNGAGFDMAYAGKLFEPFQRMHDANDYPGTGVGLAVVRRIITRHGGEVWAHAEPGRGAAITFTVPDLPFD
jgi:light-regulated signal transduction histidine kinase (bacteriophytochrome)